MSRNSGITRLGDLDSLPSWISDHLGEGSSFMTDEVNQSPTLPMEGSSPLETNPLAAIHPSVEEKTNIMTLEELDALREAYSFPPRVRVRLPEEGETITSARPGEVAFYEAAFPTGLRFPLHPTIRLILQFYNICPAQLVPNALRSIVCSMAIWRVFKYTLSLSEFRNLFSLNNNPKPDQGWLYFKARNKKTLLGRITSRGRPESLEGMRGSRSVDPLISTSHLACLYIRALLCTGAVGVEIVPPRICFSRIHGFGDCRLEPSKRRSAELVGRRGTELRRILPHIPNLTLLRWSGRKVFDPIFNRNPSSGSNPTSESCLDSSQPVELDLDAMSKRINFKKLGEKLEKSKNGSSSRIPAPAKEVVIGEKCVGENLASSASKKGKVDDGSKGKGVDREPEGKKKATSSTNARTTSATASSRPGEGTSATLGAVLGPTASILGSPSMAEKLLRGVIPPADKEKVEKLTLDQTATKLFHVIGQENDELAKTKSDRDSLADKVERSGVLVVELREALSKAKEFVVEEFKSSSEFVVAIEDSASKYFGEGFDFCKVQLRQHHPDLAIDLERAMVKQDLLAEQDEAAEEKEKEKVGENEGAKLYWRPLNLTAPRMPSLRGRSR
ncbi:hypothetical protein Acr_18g0011750 [Actinidia rufa]|uniref:Transposase (putative) gypsy type domain-containing protein n=1 Tax=Actinidia rufa TaxID=165716 RepID=A0A7J0G872_9ERIC|nr:hypothetical protein Acr_18g0011750 [Actinidia rufa]